jgi:hypothetical protein
MGGFKNPDAPADIFMLGKSFYVLVTGRDPLYLVGDDIPEPLFHVIQKCCAIEKASRYPSLSELKQRLAAVYDVLLNRVDGFAKTRQVLATINERLAQEQKYVTEEVLEFLDGLSRLAADDHAKLFDDVDSSFFHVLCQPPFNAHISHFLQIYRRMVEASNYGWSYAEVIAKNMQIVFAAGDVPVADKATALELAVYAAIAQHRFAAMDTCRGMITAVKDETLGLAIQDILKNNADSFIAQIEPSECQSDVIRKTIREIRARTKE